MSGAPAQAVACVGKGSAAECFSCGALSRMKFHGAGSDAVEVTGLEVRASGADFVRFAILCRFEPCPVSGVQIKNKRHPLS